MLNRSIETDLVPYSLDKNIGIIAYSPMERGLLTGKYFAGGKLAENDHRNGYFNQYDLKKVQQFLQNIQPIADVKNSTLAQLVLRWTVQQPGITAVLAGARNAEQAISNAQALHFELNPEELIFITNQLHTL